MRAVESRFVGKGNIFVGDGRLRGWQVECSQCGTIKTVSSHRDRAIPPNMVVKKILVSGWYLGHSPQEDVCPGCRSKRPPKQPANGNGAKPIKTWKTLEDYFLQLRDQIILAKKALEAKHTNKAAGYIDNALRQLRSDVTAAALATVQSLAKSEPQPALETAKPTEVAPAKPVRKPAPKPEPPVMESETDFEQWLTGHSREWLAGR